MDYVVDYGELLSAPRWDWLQVEVSGLCNAACSYCALSCYKAGWQGGLMEEETFERLAREFRHANLVFLQGWGEPLLHPRFWEMACRVKSEGAQVGFTTNGTCLDAANLTKLLDTPMDVLAVSIAGTTAATSDGWRAGNDFTRLGISLEDLKRMKRDRNVAGPRVHIAYMLLASNWREVEALPVLAQRWGAKQVVVNNLSFICNAALEKESLFERPDLWEPAISVLEDAQQRAAALKIDFYYCRPDRQEPHAVCTENVLRSCFLSYRGDVSPCVLTNLSTRQGSTPTCSFRGRAYPVERLVFGNVRKQSLDEIWHSTQARAFRTAFELRLKRRHPVPRDLPLPCRQCYKLLEGMT
jgi:MoaA/NifB/PqqE/SkfB family radical SAM enzyme